MVHRRTARGSSFKPVIFLVIALDNLNIFGLANRCEVHTRVGDHALDALNSAAHHIGQIRAAIEPIVEAAQEWEGLWIASVSCFDEAVRNPGTRIAASLGVEDQVLRIGHDVTVGRAALFDSIDNCVHGCAELDMVNPAECICSAHKEAAGAGAGKTGFPKRNRLAHAGADRLAGTLAEGTKHVVD